MENKNKREKRNLDYKISKNGETILNQENELISKNLYRKFLSDIEKYIILKNKDIEIKFVESLSELIRTKEQMQNGKKSHFYYDENNKNLIFECNVSNKQINDNIKKIVNFFNKNGYFIEITKNNIESKPREESINEDNILKSNNQKELELKEENNNRSHEQETLIKEKQIKEITPEPEIIEINPIESNMIIFGNPHAGKTSFIKKLNKAKYKIIDLEIQNPDNSIEWKKNILYKNFSDKAIIGNVLDTIINATLEPNKKFILFLDEAGIYELDYILGMKLKSIFKIGQKINIDLKKEDSELYLKMYKEVKENLDKVNKEEQLQKQIELLDIINQLSRIIYHAKIAENPTSFTEYKEDEISFQLWIPNNLFFILCSNYENNIIKSLNLLKGWGENGDRFKIKHFYPVSKDTSQRFLFEGNINETVLKWNDAIYKTINDINNEADKKNLSNQLNIDLNQYRLYFSNYDKRFSCSEINKNELIQEITYKLQNLFLEEEEIEYFINKLNENLNKNI